MWVGEVYPCDFGNLGSRAGKDGAWISKDMPAYGFTGFIGGRCVEGSEWGKLRKTDVNADFLRNLASSGLQWGFASLELAAGQLKLGGRILAHGKDMAKGIAKNYGGNFNHGPDYNSLQRVNSEYRVPIRAYTQTVGGFAIAVPSDRIDSGGYIGRGCSIIQRLACAYETTRKWSVAWACRDAGGK